MLTDDQKLYAAGGLAMVLGAFWWWRKRSVSTNDGTDAAAAPGDGPNNQTFDQEQYAPYAPETNDLFTAASAIAGTPVEWATLDSLHQLLKAESGGWVGIPNYQFGNFWGGKHREQWPAIWQAIQDGTWKSLILPEYQGGAMSSATGLGQLTISNIPDFYPSGAAGIGNALEEAVGMLKYIAGHPGYGDPDIAWTFHLEHGWY